MSTFTDDKSFENALSGYLAGVPTEENALKSVASDLNANANNASTAVEQISQFTFNKIGDADANDASSVLKLYLTHLKSGGRDPRLDRRALTILAQCFKPFEGGNAPKVLEEHKEQKSGGPVVTINSAKLQVINAKLKLKDVQEKHAHLHNNEKEQSEAIAAAEKAIASMELVVASFQGDGNYIEPLMAPSDLTEFPGSNTLMAPSDHEQLTAATVTEQVDKLAALKDELNKLKSAYAKTLESVSNSHNLEMERKNFLEMSNHKLRSVQASAAGSDSAILEVLKCYPDDQLSVSDSIKRSTAGGLDELAELAAQVLLQLKSQLFISGSSVVGNVVSNLDIPGSSEAKVLGALYSTTIKAIGRSYEGPLLTSFNLELKEALDTAEFKTQSVDNSLFREIIVLNKIARAGFDPRSWTQRIGVPASGAVERLLDLWDLNGRDQLTAAAIKGAFYPSNLSMSEPIGVALLPEVKFEKKEAAAPSPKAGDAKDE